MKAEIKENIDNPEVLEKLYRYNKKDFESEFLKVYPEISGNKLANFWKIRLQNGRPKESKNKVEKMDLLFLILSCVITCFLIKIPVVFHTTGLENSFYERNSGLIVLLGLSIYTVLTKRLFKMSHLMIFLGAFALSAIYINLLPINIESSLINLAYIHLPLFLWCIYGFVYIGFDIKDKTKRIDFIKYNGDLIVLSTIILIAGVLMTYITYFLFTAIGVDIKDFYMGYIVLFGLVSAPIAATYIIANYPSVTNKIAPLIATIFSPLALITLIVYLSFIPFARKDLYNDRNFLLAFNVMLLAVMALIIFSISEISTNKKQKFNKIVLFTLAIVTLIVNLVALSAIVYRLSEFGFSPNRIAVLGSNLVIFGNLILITVDLFKAIFRKAEIHQVELTISKYLPVYVIWTFIVAFGFPVIF